MSTHRGKWGHLTPWKYGYKIKKRKHAKKESNQGRQLQRTGLCWPHIYSDILQNAPFRSQILFASGGIDPPSQNPADAVVRDVWTGFSQSVALSSYDCVQKHEHITHWYLYRQLSPLQSHRNDTTAAVAQCAPQHDRNNIFTDHCLQS